MISKLLSLLGAAKGATVAAVVVLSATTATVAVSSPEVRDTVEQVVSAVTGQAAETEEVKSEKAAKAEKADRCDTDGSGQPAVVAQRNAADKLLRASFQTHQKALEDLRGKGVDNQAAGPIVKKADGELKDVLTKALNAIAANTQGREGQNKDATAAGTPKPSASPKASASPGASCAPKASGSPKPSSSPKVEADGSAKPSQEGRVTVAERTTLTAANKAIVDKAIADMDAIVKAAQAAVGALPTPDHGKPSGEPGSNGNKPADAGSNGNKPATIPGGKPSETPKR